MPHPTGLSSWNQQLDSIEKGGQSKSTKVGAWI
jgi:hypothetical protein